LLVKSEVQLELHGLSIFVGFRRDISVIDVKSLLLVTSSIQSDFPRSRWSSITPDRWSSPALPPKRTSQLEPRRLTTPNLSAWNISVMDTVYWHMWCTKSLSFWLWYPQAIPVGL